MIRHEEVEDEPPWLQSLLWPDGVLRPLEISVRALSVVAIRAQFWLVDPWVDEVA